MALFWLSFADDDGFRGVAFIVANDMVSAVRRTHLLGINPGGQVLGPEIPTDADQYDVAFAHRDRLIQKDELMQLFPDATRVSDYEDEHDVDVRLPESHVIEDED